MSPRPEERDDVADVVTQLRYPPSLKRVADEAFEVSRNDLRILLQARTKGANLIERQAAELAALRSERAALPVCSEHEAELTDLPVACVVCEREQMAARIATLEAERDRIRGVEIPGLHAVIEEQAPALSEYRGDERAGAYEWKIDREGPMLYISHAKWSLVGMGDTLAEAGRDLENEMLDLFALFHAHDDLGADARAMVEWLRETMDYRVERAEPRTSPASEPGPTNPADPSPREEP